MKMIRKKLRSASGETLAETMVAMVIVVLGMMLLAGAIVAAAKVNASAREQNAWSDTVNGATEIVTIHASYTNAAGEDKSADLGSYDLRWYETGNGGLYFYGN